MNNHLKTFDASALPRRTAGSIRSAVALGVMAAAGAAMADGIDTSSAVSTLATGAAAISAIGGGLLALAVLKKLWGKVGGR